MSILRQINYNDDDGDGDSIGTRCHKSALFSLKFKVCLYVDDWGKKAGHSSPHLDIMRI